MAVPLPELEGAEHEFLELATGVRAHVALAGPPDAPPVLALHGWPQHWWTWRRVLPLLADEYRVIAPDLRGLGWSGFPADGDFTKRRLADDAVALLDAMGIERAHVMGHDWGGYAGILLALQAPERVRSLLAMSVGHPWVPQATAALNGWRLAYQVPLAMPMLGAALTRDGRYLRAVLRAAWGEEGTWDEEAAELYLEVMREPVPARASGLYYRHFLLRDLPAAARGAFGGKRLAMPARLLLGRRDPLGTAFAEGFDRGGEDASLELVDGAGHFLPEERPELVAERAREMFSREPAGS
jgi:pimeloyl-ACP methyl ester carboxylesterase